MSVIPAQVSQEDLFALLVLKSHQLTPREKQMMLQDLAAVKARRLQDENRQNETRQDGTRQNKTKQNKTRQTQHLVNDSDEVEESDEVE